jgi:hypothetical protein
MAPPLHCYPEVAKDRGNKKRGRPRREVEWRCLRRATNMRKTEAELNKGDKVLWGDGKWMDLGGEGGGGDSRKVRVSCWLYGAKEAN